MLNAKNAGENLGKVLWDSDRNINPLLFHASVAAMQGILGNMGLIESIVENGDQSELLCDAVAINAVTSAKALLAELDKEGGE